MIFNLTLITVRQKLTVRWDKIVRKVSYVMDTVSAVIPHYGDAQLTLELVNALKKQQGAIDLQIIVSDDCSPKPFPSTEGVTVIRREINGGFGANVNSGVEQARGQWLLILNSDLSLQPSFVSQMLETAQAGAQAIYGPAILDHNCKFQWSARKFPTTFQFAWEWFTPLARFRNTTWWHRMVGHDVALTVGKSGETEWLMGACLMMPTELYRSLGGMDESYFMNSEEVDFQYRAAQHGVPRIFLGNITVHHVGGASSGESQKRRRWVVEARSLYSQKWNLNRNMKKVLLAVTWINYGFNQVRSISNKKVDAKEILSAELSLLE